MDQKLIEKINSFANADLSKSSLEEKLEYYHNLLKKMDKLLNDKNINLDDFEQLLEIKKQIMSKINTEKRNME